MGCDGVDWIDLFKEGETLLDLLTALVKFWVSWKWGEGGGGSVLTSWGTVSFSRITLVPEKLSPFPICEPHCGYVT
jgi:hypothetical protein